MCLFDILLFLRVLVIVQLTSLVSSFRPTFDQCRHRNSPNTLGSGVASVAVCFPRVYCMSLSAGSFVLCMLFRQAVLFWAKLASTSARYLKYFEQFSLLAFSSLELAWRLVLSRFPMSIGALSSNRKDWIEFNWRFVAVRVVFDLADQLRLLKNLSGIEISLHGSQALRRPGSSLTPID